MEMEAGRQTGRRMRDCGAVKRLGSEWIRP